MIPARLGSQRFKEKNLKKINGLTLIELCVKKCVESNVFDEVWVNSESSVIGKLGERYGAKFYKRSDELANSIATSEEFVQDFLSKIDCDYLFQVHTIAPLLTSTQVKDFVNSFVESGDNTGLVYEEIVLESFYKGKPLNFSYDKKQNSQDLEPIQKVSWSISGWKANEFVNNNNCKTYTTPVYLHRLPKEATIVIKTEEDYELCKLIKSRRKQK